MKKYVSDCNECKEQKKASVCRECHNYWMGKLDEAIDSRSSAIGKLGAYKTNFLKAQAGEKKVIADFIELTHAKSQDEKDIVEKNDYLQFKEKQITSLISQLADSMDALVSKKKALYSEKGKKNALIDATIKIKKMSEFGNKLFGRKLALQMIWKKAAEALGEVSED